MMYICGENLIQFASLEMNLTQLYLYGCVYSLWLPQWWLTYLLGLYSISFGLFLQTSTA